MARKLRENHHRWKGGKHKSDKGYILIYMPEHHRAGKSGYVFEHILIMEKKLGKTIAREDGEIHHKDENKSNNDPKNLQLLSKREHRRIHSFSNQKVQSYSWGKHKKLKGKVVPKEKLPHGYYYLRII